jgi:hypothetical protein
MMPIIYVDAHLKKIVSVCQIQRYRRSCSSALPKSDYTGESFEHAKLDFKAFSEITEYQHCIIKLIPCADVFMPPDTIVFYHKHY